MTNHAYDLFSTSSMPHTRKLIINAALTGNLHQRSDNPAVPYLPEEIVDDARRCYLAGASMFHIHARDGTGKPSCQKEHYAEIVAGIRKRCPDSIVCLTTSGRVFKTFEQRTAVLSLEGELKPDFASLSLGSMNFPNTESVNSPQMIEKLAVMMDRRGIRPELEVFETGMINYGRFLLKKGILKAPLFFNLFHGILGTMPGRMVDLCHMAGALPDGSEWGAAGGGRFQLPINVSAMLMGGHVRTGIEDNIWMDHDKKTPATNELLVKRIARIATEIGRPVASPKEAREILGLKK
ncbi:MAG: 3-keto-5-aminohexanoate cleavage protein [Candidatus Micrarchaeia archaeon]